MIRVMYREGQGVLKDINESEKWGLKPFSKVGKEEKEYFDAVGEWYNKLFEELNVKWRQANPQ